MSTCNQPVGLANTWISTDYAQKSPDHCTPTQLAHPARGFDPNGSGPLTGGKW
jgi:hypothetical protein